MRLVLPRKQQAIVKGHKGVSKSGLTLANGLINSKIGIWKDMDDLVALHPELGKVRQGVAESLSMARAGNTLSAYSTPVTEWQRYSEEFNKVPFPVDQGLFMFFLQSRIDYDKAKGNKAGGLCNRVYALDLVCSMLGVTGPGSLAPVRAMLEAGRRQLGRPTVKKLPCNKELLVRLVINLVPQNGTPQNLCDLRTAVFCLLGFVLEGRRNEIAAICPSDITDYGNYMVAFIEVRKCSQYREGAFVPFMDSGDVRGACNLLRYFLSLIPEGNPDVPIFRHLDWGKVKGWIWRPRCIGYTRMSETVKEGLRAIGVDSGLYGLHSFRSGAATEVGKDVSIDPRLHNKHGGWAPGSTAKDGYIEESEENLLRIPLHLAV